MLDSTGSIAAAIGRWAGSLAAHRVGADRPDEALLVLIESCERLKDACAATQVRATHECSERRLAGLTLGSTADQVARRDIGARIGRARHVSPFHGVRYLELSRMLVRDLPLTLDALAVGHTTEHRAGLVAHADACLGTADRATLDADLGPRLIGRGNRAAQGEADRIAAELDAEAVVERHRRAVAERRVTSRRAPDTMTYLTALLPVADGVATWAALDRHTTLAKAAGDRRTRGQIMADEFTHRIVYGTPTQIPGVGGAPPIPAVVPSECRVRASEAGRSVRITRSDDIPPTVADRGSRITPAAGPDETGASDPPGDSSGPPPPPVRQIDLMLVMTDRALLDGADTRGRLFPPAVRQFVLARDHRCRTPWCDAPIRHIDHTVPHSVGGPRVRATAPACVRAAIWPRARERTGPWTPGHLPRRPD